MAEAFFGYLLPWGQMSYWGAQVIVNLFAAVPFIGPDLALLIRGDYVVGDATLNRFFSFHVIAVPLVLIGLVVAHLLALHDIRDRLTQLAPIFLKNKYMLGDDFSMLDVAIAPLLWRLDYYGIDLSKNAMPLLKYAERIFQRPAYIEALTPSEKVMRK
ncbi:hypothetical protein B566_EDAN019290 [Ephemera danica]|nr:hypothetical protein B566_EDAN019290 [Ephemera danica]